MLIYSFIDNRNYQINDNFFLELNFINLYINYLSKKINFINKSF